MEIREKNLLKRKNIQDAIFFMIASISMIVYSLKKHYGSTKLDWRMSPYLFPILISVFVALLSITLFLGEWKKIKEGQEDTSKDVQKTKVNLKGVLYTISVSILYLIGMKLIGFIISTILFLAALFIYLGERRIWLIALVSIGTVASIYIIFAKLLHVMLP